jgi:Response regulators consisting of a CheY-like receiver domain and a winged-helix DNA-binding domain
MGLPDLDGIEVCRELRRRSGVAIIVVTARGQEQERIAGLRTGADDYVVKPFGIAELQARINAVMRRTAWSTTSRGELTFHNVTVDLDAHRVVVGGSEISLTRKEYALLAALARRPGSVVTREELLADIWQTTWTGNPHTVEVHIASLRAKLGEPGLVQTVRGVGYRLRALE